LLPDGEKLLDGIKNYLLDMDGVILRGATLIPGATDFIQRLKIQKIPFLIFTNNSLYTPRDLQVRLSYMGLDVPSEAICNYSAAKRGGRRGEPTMAERKAVKR
jgi:NagD protein